MEEGYIKFQTVWEKTPPPADEAVAELSRWRDEMHCLGLIGVYENGIGFGNISQRLDAEGRFLITGSATGQYPTLTAAQFTQVIDFQAEKNTVTCRGPILASSESMSHAVVYRECPEVGGVIHVHHATLWEGLLHRVPTTDAAATYGSPEMALSILRLLRETDLRATKIFVMEGHPEGIFAFGDSLEEAAGLLRQLLAR